MSGHNPNAEQGPPRGAAAAAAEDEAYDQTEREFMKKTGFDPEDVNKFDRFGHIPMTWNCAMGSFKTVQYLIVRRNADCRQLDRWGCSPMLRAAEVGYLEIMKLLSQVGGAHEDIRTQNRFGCSPLRAALKYNRVAVWKWLIRKGALAPLDDLDGGGIDDMIMRRDLRQEIGGHWQEDKRLTVLAWAQTSVAAYENVKVFLTGTIVPASSSVCRHPKNPYATRSHKRRKVVSPSSLLAIFKGKSGILELIAHFIAGTPQQLRTLRLLVDRLPDFIARVPFIIEEEEDDEDEDDY